MVHIVQAELNLFPVAYVILQDLWDCHSLIFPQILEKDSQWQSVSIAFELREEAKRISEEAVATLKLVFVYSHIFAMIDAYDNNLFLFHLVRLSSLAPGSSCA